MKLFAGVFNMAVFGVLLSSGYPSQELATEVEDLGVITPLVGDINLVHDQRRVDFKEFKVKIFAHFWQTNDIYLTVTNDILEFERLGRVAEGHTLMEVYSIHLDGSMSDTNKFKFNLQRMKAGRPKAAVIAKSPLPTLPNGGIAPLPNSLTSVTNRLNLIWTSQRQNR